MPHTSRCNQPLLLVDVDGVLSLFGFEGTSPGRAGHTGAPASPRGEPTGIGALIDGLPHLLSQHAADLLTALASDFECVWCTGWQERADEHLPHLLGLPRGWPHLVFEQATGPGASTLGHWKLGAIDAFAGHERPLAWIDDAHDDACAAWAEARPGPTLLVGTEPAVGLTEVHAAALRAWRSALARR